MDSTPKDGLQVCNCKNKENKELSEAQIEGLKRLREPFPKELIGKKPKPTAKQRDCSFQEKIHCDICGQFHHPKVKDLIQHNENEYMMISFSLVL